MDKETAYKRLYDRVMLLSRGIVVPPRRWWMPIKHLQSFYGGPGPLGRKYYICYNESEQPRNMISLPMFPRNHYFSKCAIKTKRSKINKHNLITDNGLILKGIQPPRSRNMVLSNGLSINRTGLVNIHCYNTYATNLYWTCQHFENSEQCRFCTLEVPKNKWKQSNRYSDEEIIEALKLTEQNSKLRSITITSGTYPNSDQVATDLIVLARKLKDATKLSIHVQFEPVSDYGLLKELSNYVDSVGIFLEVFDEDLRKKVCPGKSRISREEYFKTWEKAVKCFGWGKVWSTCLLGFGEDYEKILFDLEKCAKMGVRTMLFLVRLGSVSLGKDFIPSYVEHEKELVDLHIKLSKVLINNNLEAKVGAGSGCIGCQGCTAMVEACQYTRTN